MEEILKSTYKILHFQDTVNSSFTAMSLSEYRITTLDYIYRKYLNSLACFSKVIQKLFASNWAYSHLPLYIFFLFRDTNLGEITVKLPLTKNQSGNSNKQTKFTLGHMLRNWIAGVTPYGQDLTQIKS